MATCRFRHVEAGGQPRNKSKKSGVKGSVALLKESINLRCVSQYSYPRKSFPREQRRLGSKHTVKFSKGTWHRVKFWERKSPWQGIMQKCEPHERNPCTQVCGKDTRRNLAPRKMRPQSSMGLGENIYKLQNADKATFYFTLLCKPSQRRRPLQNLQSTKDLSADETETLLRSRMPTTVVTANGEVQTNEEAQVHVHDFELFVTVQLLDDTLAVLSHGELCEEHGYTYEWASGQKPRLTKQGKNILCKTGNFVPFVVSLDCRPILVPVTPLHDRREWLEVITDNLEDAEVHAPAHSAHD